MMCLCASVFLSWEDIPCMWNYFQILHNEHFANFNNLLNNLTQLNKFWNISDLLPKLCEMKFLLDC